jgi:hypothetical protein
VRGRSGTNAGSEWSGDSSSLIHLTVSLQLGERKGKVLSLAVATCPHLKMTHDQSRYAPHRKSTQKTDSPKNINYFLVESSAVPADEASRPVGRGVPAARAPPFSRGEAKSNPRHVEHMERGTEIWASD